MLFWEMVAVWLMRLLIFLCVACVLCFIAVLVLAHDELKSIDFDEDDEE